MKTKFNYKSKKTIIIAVVVLALIVISGIAVSLFLKGNDSTEAVGGNTAGNTIDNNANENTPSNNEQGNNTENDGENANNNQNGENGGNDADNAADGNDNQADNQGAANNNANQGNANNNGANVPNQEYVTERVETIPERVVAESYTVSWEPTQFETLVSGAISVEKANIIAEKTVAKVTANGLEQNPEVVKVGEILQYTITLTNTSNKVTGLVNVIDIIPTGTEFVSATEANLKTTPAEYENASEVTSLAWKNVKVKAGSEVKLVVNVKVVAKIENTDTTSVKNVATIYDGTTPETEVPSPETKVANITSNKTSTIIYNEEKPHEHILVDGVEPLHEQDIIEYTITLTNVGEAAGTVKVSDTVPEGTTFINGGVVTVVDQNGTTTHTMEELVEGLDVTVPAQQENVAGVATVTFRVIVNSFDEESKVIKNDMAKVDGSSTNTTEDSADKVYIDIPVLKVWDNMESDAAQVYTLASIKFQVKNGETVVAEKVVAKEADEANGIAGGWTYTFQNLPKYDANGNEINYTIVELAVNDDEQEILDTYYNSEAIYNVETDENIDTTNVTITNTFDPSEVQDETIDIAARKEWLNMESDAAQDYAMTSITLQVRVYLEDGSYVLAAMQEVTGPNWTAEFTGLKKYDIYGNEIEYAVDEVVTANEEDKEAEKADAEKLLAYDKNITTAEDGTVIVTNKFNPESDVVKDDTTPITIKKVWDDQGNKAGERPTSVVLTLNGVDHALTAADDEDTTTADEWTLTVNDLQKYNADGTEIVYAVTEKAENVPAKYTKTSEEGLTVTNTIDFTKVTTPITIKKIWVDESNKAGERPTSVVLTLNGVDHTLTAADDEDTTTQNEWTLTVNDLQKYNADGTEIVYAATEKAENVPAKYTKTSEEGLTVTNTIDFTQVTTPITIKKVWDDQGDKAGERPTDVVLTVGGTDYTLNKDNDADPTTANEWTLVVDLQKYNANGSEITYAATEANVPDKYAKTESGLTVTNKIDFTKVTTPITIKKVWVDEGNKAGERPTSVVLTLNGVDHTLTAADDEDTTTTNEWTLTVDGLQKYNADGTEIVYAVTEKAENVPAKYTKTSEEGLTVTNTIDFTQVTTSKTIKKIWVDESNKAGERPTSVVLTLNGVDHTLTAADDEDTTTTNEWTLTVDGLQKYNADGTEIVYAVTEKAENVPAKYTKTSEEGLTVTNTIDFTQVTTPITIKKVWDDQGNKAGERPTDVVLTVGGTDYTLNKDNDSDPTTADEWTLVVDLQKYNADGSEITYTATEANVPDKYAKTESGLTVTNKIDFTQVTTPITIKKVWDDQGDKAGERPTDVVLTVGGTDYTLNKDNDSDPTTADEWTLVVDLQKYNADGSEITYAAIEANVPDKYTKTESGLTVTNTIDFTQVTTSKTIKKIWDDNSDKYEARPEYVVLTVGETDYTLTAENDEDTTTTNEWTLTVNLQKYNADGTEITYAVTEKEANIPAKYKAPTYSADGLTVTNSIDIDEVITQQTGTITTKVTYTTTATVQTPMDIVFVIDTSGSMEGDNATSMVNAVNDSIATLKASDPNNQNRIGIAVFSDDVEILVPLSTYSATGDYLTLNANKDMITENVTGSSNTRDIVGGTYTQLGIQQGANMLLTTDENFDRTFSVTVNNQTVTGTRTPVLILITDGDPTYYSASEDLSTETIGTGNTSWFTAENYSYWTIRTAKYYKDQVSSTYYGTNYGTTGKQAKMFTIGIGIGDTGEYLAKAMLNPNATNVSNCYDGSQIENILGFPVDLRTSNQKLYDMIAEEDTPSKLDKYSYADGSTSGALTEDDIEEFLTSSLESSTESLVIRSITESETTNRKVDLTNIDTTKEFALQIIAEDGNTIKEFTSLAEALKPENGTEQYGAYVKQEQSGAYYVDLSGVDKTATVNITYWETAQTQSGT